MTVELPEANNFFIFKLIPIFLKIINMIFKNLWVRILKYFFFQ